MTEEQLQTALGNSAQEVKLICGVGNNAAWNVMMDAYDHAKQCRRFNQSVKGGRVSNYFKRAIQDFKDYERNLLRCSVNRMFHLADMSEEIRRKYGDITDDEFYEFWKGIGAIAHQKTKPLITSLWNKYRLSLINHHVDDDTAEHIAWVMTAQACIDLAGIMYDYAMKECETGHKVPRKILDHVFGQFSLKRVSRSWWRAMMALEPRLETITLSDTDEKNIEHGLRQLNEAWTDPSLLYDATSGAVEDYEEIFATSGQAKKALREIAEVKEETLNILNDE